MRTVIEKGYVIPVTTDEVIPDGVVAFDNDRLVYVGPRSGFEAAKFAADRIIDASGKAVLPGLVNTHIHLAGAYIKALSEDVPGKSKGNGEGFFKRAIPTVAHMKPDDYYWGGMTHGMEAVMTGSTTINNSWYDEAQTGVIVRDLGVRAVLSEFVQEVNFLAMHATQMDRPFDREMGARHLERAEKLYDNWHRKENGRITVRLAPSSVAYTSPETIEQCGELARRLGIGMNIHIAEVPGETEFVMKQYGVRPIALANKLGILGSDCIAFHHVFLDDSDIQTLSDTKTYLSHSSFHVPKRGYFPPMEKIYAKGIEVSLGSDWTNNDMWKFMRAAIMIPRARSGDVSMLSGYDALRMATLVGARALGMEHDIGTLEPGKKADIVLLDVSTPWCQPIYTPNLITNIVWNANGSDVSDVFVDGEQIVKDKEFIKADRREIQKETQRRAERIWADAEKMVPGSMSWPT
ncbi:amidohydrolase family protein [Tardiphaga robiniae]|uniref:Amidohydrolase family protein n=1 Tax=Tardiphaga robiniae TaxID=943830 RepID=A0A7G6U1J7_9BRAD|nr:amidohydrolase family protein [Tardiphaga robiniae]QND72879.1 amidohydrolase family protein [Tardiphaga robiniae]